MSGCPVKIGELEAPAEFLDFDHRCPRHRKDAEALWTRMREEGRIHFETY
ncbi:hypothetical protein C8K11_10239 [Novosphingobium sp. GV055]|nr:hypothetical protein C8K11_10239 [Novosphingobium sp. GV055]PUB06370.1 hypothetical protein C8K12_10239 [Novosphingobium sp. GV061]PUB22421.1 hypothetical protein C8K14_10239 [Novosphingobium sp. GV079]PUB44446.1 hypothetical protein C8K10_10239 [Novosphingobium sp. GV027]